jgi:hypothetical protein
MPTINLVCARTTANRVLDAITNAVEDEGFEIVDEGRRWMAVHYSSPGARFWWGSLFFAYVNSDIEVKEFADFDEVENFLTWEFPWWQGVFGLGIIGGMRARKLMDTLADRIEDEIERDDGEILSRKLD